MTQIDYLHIEFDAPINAFEVPAFRGAVIEKAGKEHLAFHNHFSDEKLSYGYPVIQYKRIHGNASIICLDYGAGEFHHFFNNKSWDIHIGERAVKLPIKHMLLKQIELKVRHGSFKYNLRNWLAFSQENYQKFQSIGNSTQELEFLKQILIGNIISFAKGVKWQIDQEIIVNIQEITNRKLLKYKKQTMLGIDLQFETNVFLPNYIGLGKAVSHGYGIVQYININQ